MKSMLKKKKPQDFLVVEIGNVVNRNSFTPLIKLRIMPKKMNLKRFNYITAATIETTPLPPLNKSTTATPLRFQKNKAPLKPGGIIIISDIFVPYHIILEQFSEAYNAKIFVKARMAHVLFEKLQDAVNAVVGGTVSINSTKYKMTLKEMNEEIKPQYEVYKNNQNEQIGEYQKELNRRLFKINNLDRELKQKDDDLKKLN